MVAATPLHATDTPGATGASLTPPVADLAEPASGRSVPSLALLGLAGALLLGALAPAWAGRVRPPRYGVRSPLVAKAPWVLATVAFGILIGVLLTEMMGGGAG